MQPGVHGLWSRIRSIGPRRATLRQDVMAGLPGSVASVPDGMASAVLAGVNPIHGLYAAFAGPVGGGLTSSTRLMVITTTSAAALAAGSAIADVPEADRAEALFLLTILAGAAMIAAGVLRLGRYTRFVSLSVMLGFLTGIAVNIVFGQVPALAGVDADGSTPLARAFDVVIHPSAIQLASLVTGLAALALAIVLARTRVGPLATVLALAIPTIATLGLEQIQRVEDEGAIPSGIPLPHLPELGLLSLNLVVSALAIAAIVLVQGAGVAEIAPNEDAGPSSANRDFVAQGVGNVASGLVRGLPVGGSVGATALNVSAGARSRWAGILVGLWVFVILLLFTGVVAKVAMPTLAAVLIFAAVGSLRVGEIATIFRTGNTSRIALVATFVATLLLPVTTAVGVGVVLSLMLQLNREALDLTVTQIIPGPNGRFVERPLPDSLASRAVTLLDVYGSLYYAGAKTLQARLPDPAGATRPAVVLRLRGRTALGATSFAILADYAQRLAAVDGRLFLSGVDPQLFQQLRRTRRIDRDEVGIFTATPTLGESSRAAYEAARRWVEDDDAAPPPTRIG